MIVSPLSLSSTKIHLIFTLSGVLLLNVLFYLCFKDVANIKTILDLIKDYS